MCKYIVAAIITLFSLQVSAQSPHGDDFDLDCSLCHSIYDWNVKQDTIKFDHSGTSFNLTGQHSTVNCKSCHQSLVFSQSKSECSSCHTDMHEQTVGQDCSRCHNTKSWIVEDIIQVHRMSRFPLLGAHQQEDCAECHKTASNLRFEPLSVECISCHRQDYLTARNPDHVSSGFSTNCEDCHGVGSNEWTFTAFAHEFFPLTGGHHLTNCFQCHNTGSYKGLSSECVKCHAEDYNNTINPSHVELQFGVHCNECHTLSPGWNPAEFKEHDNISFPIYSDSHRGEWNKCSDCHSDKSNYAVFTCTDCHEHNKSSMDGEHGGINGYSYQSTACYSCHPRGSGEEAFNHAGTNFPLLGAHVNTECSQCHVTQTTPSVDCVGCHETSYSNAKNPDHKTIGIEKTCGDCHDSYAWRPSSFDHTSTGFELTGQHVATECSQCHTTANTQPGQDCFSCHNDKYNSAPEHLSQNYPQDCAMCHNSSDWKQTDFNHNTTAFPLLGSHQNADCYSCHVSGFTGTTHICSDCHKSDFDNSLNPNHSAIGLALTCENCHDSFAWKPSSFDHASTGFQLLGQHATTDCNQCHTNATQLSQDCFVCHTDKYNTAPEHLSQNYPKDCVMCHNSSDWKQTDFNHSTTAFPLLGSHQNADCASCHISGFTGTTHICSDCHKTDFDNSLNPNHAAIGLALTCENCHDSFAWKPSSFDHASTGFQLLGQHATTDCNQCHTNTAQLSQDCFVCHTDKYNTAPEHLSQNYPKDCVMCHNSSDWKQTDFNHSTTAFPLLGSHQNADCASCHTSGFTGTTHICSDCHKSDFDNSLNPNHAAIGLALTCENCHDSFAWKPSSFDHGSTGFQLLGQHATTDCNQCHTNTTQPSQDCFVCHTDKYNTAPEHLSQNYPKDCAICHNSSDWKQTDFNHSTTNFPLTGAHTTVLCADCHSAGYVGTSTACNDCHNDNYSSTTNPNHKTLNLSLSCETCHTTTPGWSPATFPVHNDFYVLQGAHAGIKNLCNDCHKDNYNNTPNTCIGCHQTDYNNATNPNHTSSGFSTDCASCHSQTAWKPSTFDHDNQYFPIYSGTHRGEWNQCSDCHLVQSNFAVFSCIDCHEHNKADTDSEHREVNDYKYESNACYDCHPKGQESSFLREPTHSNTSFKLLGAHAELQCGSCHNDLQHPENVKCMSCHEHSTGRIKTIHRNIAGFSINENNCLDCHRSGRAVQISE